MGAILQRACAAPAMNQVQRLNRKMIEQRVPIAMLAPRHCVGLAVHEVIPATVEPTLSSDDRQLPTLDCGSVDPEFSPAVPPLEHVVQSDLKCPPNDLVVTLHRFLI